MQIFFKHFNWKCFRLATMREGAFLSVYPLVKKVFNVENLLIDIPVALFDFTFNRVRKLSLEERDPRFNRHC